MKRIAIFAILLAWPVLALGQSNGVMPGTGPRYQPAVPAASTQVYNGGYGYGGADGAGRRLAGHVAGDRAAGEAHLANSAAAINWTQAQSNEMRNRVQGTQTFWSMRDIGAAERAEARAARPRPRSLPAAPRRTRAAGHQSDQPRHRRVALARRVAAGHVYPQRVPVETSAANWVKYGTLNYADQTVMRENIDTMFDGLKGQITRSRPRITWPAGTSCKACCTPPREPRSKVANTKSKYERRELRMKTRMTTLILAACACLALSGLRAYADEKPAAALVIKDLKSATEADKLKSLNGLAHLGPQAADATKFIEGLLKDSSAKVRVHAALALGAIGPAAKDSVPALAELLKDPDAAVRRSVFHAVRAIRPGPKVMIPLATKLLEDADPAIRGRVLNTIAEAGTEAVQGLIEALKHEKAVFWALIVLRDIGPAAKDAVPGITETLKDKRPEVRREAVLTLGAMGEAAASGAPEIAKLLGDENTAVAATFVLGELGQIPKGSEATIRPMPKAPTSF